MRAAVVSGVGQPAVVPTCKAAMVNLPAALPMMREATAAALRHYCLIRFPCGSYIGARDTSAAQTRPATSMA